MVSPEIKIPKLLPDKRTRNKEVPSELKTPKASKKIML
jgi:hypothetical protein